MSWWAWLALTGAGGAAALWIYVFFGSYWYQYRRYTLRERIILAVLRVLRLDDPVPVIAIGENMVHIEWGDKRD